MQTSREDEAARMPTAGWQAERVARVVGLASQAEQGLDSKAISILLVAKLENPPAHLAFLSRHDSECACIKEYSREVLTSS